MASKRPIVKQVAWISIFPHVFIMACIVLSAKLIGIQSYLMTGAIIYLLISFLLRFGIPSQHRKGIALLRNDSFLEAIPFFEKSYAFFKRNPWIDKYRYITLLSSSHASYTEMALLNIAFCYGQSGSGKKSKKYYERALSEFPESEMTKASLRMFESARDISEPGKF